MLLSLPPQNASGMRSRLQRPVNVWRSRRRAMAHAVWARRGLADSPTKDASTRRAGSDLVRLCDAPSEQRQERQANAAAGVGIAWVSPEEWLQASSAWIGHLVADARGGDEGGGRAVMPGRALRALWCSGVEGCGVAWTATSDDDGGFGEVKRADARGRAVDAKSGLAQMKARGGR